MLFAKSFKYLAGYSQGGIMERKEITLELKQKTINRLNFYSKLKGISQGEALELLVREARIRGYMGMAGLLFGMVSWLLFIFEVIG